MLSNKEKKDGKMYSVSQKVYIAKYGKTGINKSCWRGQTGEILTRDKYLFLKYLKNHVKVETTDNQLEVL